MRVKKLVKVGLSEGGVYNWTSRGVQGEGLIMNVIAKKILC